MKRTMWLVGTIVVSLCGIILFLTMLRAAPAAAEREAANGESSAAAPADRSGPAFTSIAPGPPARTAFAGHQPVAQAPATPDPAIDPYIGRPPVYRPAPDSVGEWDNERVSIARVISDSGSYRLWYDGMSGGSWAVGMATSADGVNWTKDAANPVMSPGAPGSWDESFRGQTSILLEGGEYKLWYSGADVTGTWQTGYATSTNGVDWNIYGANPVLPAGGPGSWNEQETDGPSVINDGGTYKMWFHGCDAGYTICGIGYATSGDGVSWTPYGGNPVLTGTLGAWDDGFVFWPNVVKTGGTYEMWYSSNGKIGYATSGDGITWTKWPDPVVEMAWDGNSANAPSVLIQGGSYEMWFASGGIGPEQGIGYATSSDGITWTMHGGNPVLRPGGSLGLGVNYAHEWVNGWTVPSATVAVTLYDSLGTVKDTSLTMADGGGNFFTDCGTWLSGNCPDIQVGDSVSATAAGLNDEIQTIGSITGTLDDAENTVSGVLNAPIWGPPEAPITLNVRCEVWVGNGPPGIDTSAAAHTSGNTFTCDFDDVGWDLAPGQEVAIMYFEPDGNSVINVLSFPWARVNYGHDWVGMNYEAGHTFWITAADSGGSVKATATVASMPGAGWGADGFDTMHWQWSPAQPDIQPGDQITFVSDDGYYNLLQVGTVNGNVDVAADTLTGTLNAAWLSGTLPVECHPWGAFNDGLNVDVKYSSAAADGSSAYSCDWSGEWDIVPGKEIAAMYLEPDFDRVINVFRDPAPYLQIYKWADGAAAEGGNFMFHIQYWNQGDAPAEAVVITDTMQGFSYLMDTNGLAVMTGTIPGGEYAVWDLGLVPAGAYGQFDVFVEVTGVASNTVTNTVEIATANPYDDGEPWEKYSEWVGHVEANDTHLNVGKWAWTGDPAPGYDFVYAVNICNNGSTASAGVVVTDTLHPSMTLQTWWAQEPGWYELLDTGGEVVLGRHTINAFQCSEVYLQVNLDGSAWPGMYITNTATITAANDLESEDNFAFWEGEVNNPHRNVRVDKQFNWGQLVPGGQVAYGINVGNDGNVPITTSFLVTDYLPANTSFNGSWYYDQFGQHPVTPTLVTADYVVWTLTDLANGFWEYWEVILDIDGGAAPGTVLTNTAVVAPQPDEDRYDDNSSTWVELVNAPGPNLRLRKQGWWNWEGQLGYWLTIENIGTVTILSPTVTDTLPVSTTFNGEWWHQYWQYLDFVDASGTGQLFWTLERLEPGWSTGVGFNLDVDGGIIGDGGLTFGNSAAITVPPGDVNPGDNGDTAVNYTGPDIYVDKWLSGGFPAPGEIVTFTIRFGNANQWPWHSAPTSTLTDSLPAAMTFITATAPWNPDDHWTPNILPGNVLVWDWGTVWADSWWEFDVVVQISDTAEAYDVLNNVVEMYSAAGDVEPDYGNNSAAAALVVQAPQFAISKTYSSSEVAGRPVTYTLTVNNNGNLTGTNLLITDVLPANLTWVSGGVYDGGSGVISWNAAAVAGGGSLQVEFVGQLGCSGSVVNDQYRVAGSDQNIGSPLGPPVAFTIQAPTIAASFVQSTAAVEPGGTVVFTSTSTTDGGPLTSWIWDFGDGNGGSGASTSHTYALPGTYDVTLTAGDGCSYSGMTSVTDAVTVLDFMVYLPVVLKP